MKLKSIPPLGHNLISQTSNPNLNNSKENNKAMLPKSMGKDLDPLRTS